MVGRVSLRSGNFLSGDIIPLKRDFVLSIFIFSQECDKFRVLCSFI